MDSDDSGIGRGPLTGITVVDFTANMSGPFATMVLGDQGADVIKVEPPSGDVIRHVGSATDGISGYFANLNRSKRSIVLDLAQPEAAPVIDALVEHADVVVMNFRPGTASRLGIDPEAIRARRHSPIVVSIDGFGDKGPFAGRPAYDHVIQAMSGFAALQTDRATGTPGLVKQGVVDKVVGVTVAQAIVAALLERSRTGVGRHLTLSMLDIALAFMWPDGMMHLTIEEPEVVLPPIANSFRLTRTLDGHLAFALLTSQQWQRTLAALGIDDEGRMSTPQERMRAGGEFARRIAEILGSYTTDEAVELLASAGVPAAPVVPLDRLHEHPQIRASGAVQEVDHPTLGKIRQAIPPVDFGVDHETLRPAPRLGEHGVEILRQLGFDQAECDRLTRTGVVVVDSGEESLPR